MQELTSGAMASAEKVPGVHVLQTPEVLAPNVVEYLPVPHQVQSKTDPIDELLHVPATHIEHWNAPDAAYSPGAHAKHTLDPVTEIKPASQAVQLSAPLSE
jgi:hypothetical protein